MALSDTIHTVLGVMGNVSAFLLLLSPAPTFYKVWKWKSTRQFSGVPYVATLLNCLLWVFYGLPIVHPHTILVTTVNGTGVVLQIFYLTMFIVYCSKDARGKVVKEVGMVVIIYAAVVVLTLTLAHTHDRRSMIVGILAAVFCTCMYASPLSVMKLVVRTKSVKYMPFYLSLAAFANGVIWTVYAAIRFDIYIAISNGVGAVLGTVQLILYGIYYKTTRWEEDEEENGKNIGDRDQKYPNGNV